MSDKYGLLLIQRGQYWWKGARSLPIRKWSNVYY